MPLKLIRKDFLPYAHQTIDQSDIQAVVEVLQSNYLTTGPKVLEFEKAFAKYVGAKYAVAVANGTAALHAAVSAAGVQAGDEVITTPITFAASANAILYCGGKPVFADIEPDTYNIDPEAVRQEITPKTKVIIPVDFTGQPVNIQAIQRLAAEYKLVVIEDAAHALSAECNGQRIGSLADLTTFSFHPVKHITTGEGGMITTNNPQYYQKLLSFRSHGIIREPALIEDYQGEWYYEEQSLGYNYRLTDFQAALGLSQLRKADTFLARREELVGLYNDALAKIPGIITPYQAPNQRSSWHLYVIQLDPRIIKASRKEIFAGLRAMNIGVNVHYSPVYLHPYYQGLGYQRGLCPNAEAYYQQAITLPLFPAMNSQDLRDVVDALNATLKEHR